MASTADLIQQKLYDDYDLADDLILNDSEPEHNAGALLQRWRADNNLEVWEDYLAILFATSTVDTAADAANQWWDAFVP
jgi:hypothetical protein